MPAVWTSVMTLWRSSSSRLSIIIWTKFFFNILCKHCTFRELIYRPSGSDCLRSMLTIFRAIIGFIVLWRVEMDVDMACKLGSYQRDALTLTLFCDAWFLRCSKVMHACCASKWSHHICLCSWQRSVTHRRCLDANSIYESNIGNVLSIVIINNYKK